MRLISWNVNGLRACLDKGFEDFVRRDGADVICLGCAGMSGMDKRLTADLSVPVLDGVICALKFLEGMVHYGISTSKRLAYAKPEPKTLDNLPTIFATAYGNKAR